MERKYVALIAAFDSNPHVSFEFFWHLFYITGPEITCFLGVKLELQHKQ